VLRHDRAIFSRSAIEALQESLRKTVSKRKLAAVRKAQVA
jgi:large subunit ribosomal protein L4